MATKFFCDCCNKETKHRPNQFKYLCHLDDPPGCYEDEEGNAVSGREIVVDLCNKCYNDILGVAIERYKKLQNVV